MSDPKTVDQSLPPLGAFPGYKFGRTLFMSWMNALEEQANIWNDNWSKLISGNYELKDFYGALSQSVQASAESFEQMRVQMMTSNASPPWVTLTWGSGASVTVRLKQMIDGTHQLSLKLYRLGDHGPPIEANATASGPYTASLALSPDEPAKDGQYVGFLVSNKSSVPLAIASVLIDKPVVP
jgi:hypothetical protein